MYFATADPGTWRLVELSMTPMQIKQFRVNRASPEDARWLRDTINRESRKFAFRVELKEDDRLELDPGVCRWTCSSFYESSSVDGPPGERKPQLGPRRLRPEI